MENVRTLLLRGDLLKRGFFGSLYAASLFSRRVTSALIVFVLARYLTLEEFGTYSSYINIASVLLIITNFGFNEYLLVMSGKDRVKLRFYIHGFFVLSFLLFFSILFFSLFYHGAHKELFILVLLKVFLENQVCIILLTYFQFEKRFNLISVTNMGYSIIISILAISSYLMRASLARFLEFNVVLAFLYMFTQLYYIRMELLTCLKQFIRFFKFLNGGLMYYGLVMVTVTVYVQIPSLYVSCFLPKTQAAIYFAGYSISSILFLMSTAQVQKLLPELIKSTREQSIVILKNNIIIIGLLNLFIFIAFIFFGKDILLLIYSKREYLNSYLILLIFTFANLFLSMASVLACYVTANGYQKYKLYYQTEFIVIGLIVTGVMASLWGILGSALAYFFVCIYALYRYYGFINSKLGGLWKKTL